MLYYQNKNGGRFVVEGAEGGVRERGTASGEDSNCNYMRREVESCAHVEVRRISGIHGVI